MRLLQGVTEWIQMLLGFCIFFGIRGRSIGIWNREPSAETFFLHLKYWQYFGNVKTRPPKIVVTSIERLRIS